MIRRVEQGGFTSGRRRIWEDPDSTEVLLKGLYSFCNCEGKKQLVITAMQIMHIQDFCILEIKVA